MTRIVETKLVSSTGRMDKLPEPDLPEVAFAGRSNVGKSSLLNALTVRKKLFKVSKTPGRTRTIVHVETRLDSGAKIYLVDLPGYGFARVSKGAIQAWGRLIEDYLGDRSTLHLVVLLVDVRRGPEDEEADLLDYLADTGVPALLVATKIDRVPKSKRKAALDKLHRETGVKVLGTSATTRDGIDRLLRTITKACGYG
ncbi:MAG: YihA family ribosome biogenesis GTP-binding protein [Deltaproteobacteria bacterium]|nr:YihA family ribosome biogenesis GTP-binding protein [Deltaproteobacteria bacterium]